ncbi:hypothetical protein DPMN_125438 [Dreissena polymorpha]|uniref:Uncharacterized protein n=1 Tax=Dreissena polymorpha TaxID=45954 RepID=A0A9D4GVA7_DREPO|nr:hypothetical protein DPMN_125438 [Dreissena polymorpha]
MGTAIALSSMSDLDIISKNKNINQKTKMKLHDSLIDVIALYSFETWTHKSCRIATSSVRDVSSQKDT